MKQLLVSKLSSLKQFLSSKFGITKQFLFSKLDNLKPLLSPRVCKLLVLVFVLLLVLIIGLSKCSGDKTPSEEIPVGTIAVDDIENDPGINPTEGIPGSQTDINLGSMGTVTAGKLNIRKGPDSKYETNGAYHQGDRIEILETQTVDGTTWGRTNLGWIGMGYVRMDGTAVTDAIAQLVTNGSADVLGYGVVDLKELNVRLGPGTEFDKIGSVKNGVRYAYYQVSSSSDNWVRIENGWVSTDHFYLEGTIADDALTGTVTTEELNIRTGPNTSFQNIGTYDQGETVEILAQVGSWGYTERGWVFMNYVEPNAPVYSTGECRVTRGLNVRQEPNADSEIVATLSEGNIVTVLEVDGGWGRTVQGWINLKYVEYT